MAVDKLVDSTQLDADLTSVANAIRTKGGTSAQLAFPAGFVQAVQDIPTGTSPTLITKTITENGTYEASDDDADGYSEVTVNVSGGGGEDDFTTHPGGNIAAIISHGTEYILTDYYPLMNILYSIKLSDDNLTAWEGYFAASNGSNNVSVQRNSSSWQFVVKLQTSGNTSYTVPGYGDHIPVVVSMSCVGKSAITATNPIVICGSYYNGALEATKGKFTFYGLNVADSYTHILARFVPWLENNVPCVKDIVNNKLYYNAGTGGFDYIDLEGVLHSA